MDELSKAIVVDSHEGHIDVISVENQGVTASLVFGVGVNIRVVPEAGDVDILGPKGLDTHQRAGGTTDMKERFHSKTPSSKTPERTLPIEM